MQDDMLDPEDAAALREPTVSGRGELKQQLSNAIVARSLSSTSGADHRSAGPIWSPTW
jgi:hypothetical protein